MTNYNFYSGQQTTGTFTLWIDRKVVASCTVPVDNDEDIVVRISKDAQARFKRNIFDWIAVHALGGVAL